jgi:ABC-2 type transport system ATP-binding protein
MISAHGLRKRYGAHEALTGVDLEVRRGEVLAILGPNGAGKTTLIEILAGFRTRDAGALSVLGEDPATAGRAWRELIGVVLQESEPDPGLTVRECLELYAGYYRAPREPAEMIDLVGLTEAADRPAESLSGGQRRRLDLALALVGDPELLFLDEPTTGFDPAARRAAWDTIERLGITIVLTTHAMDEAERLADRIAVLAGGRISATGTPATLGGRDRRAAEITFTLPPGAGFPDGLVTAHGRAVRPATDRSQGLGTPDDRAVRLTTDHPLEDIRALAEWALANGLDLPDLELRRPALEDVYLALANQESPCPLP